MLCFLLFFCFRGRCFICFFFFFSSRRRHTRSLCDWSSDVCSSDLPEHPPVGQLCLTHGNDGIEDSLGTVLATFLKRTGDIRVIRAWRPRFRQTKGHRYNHKAPAPFLLEKTVAVAERARVAIEFPHFSRR